MAEIVCKKIAISQNWSKWCS